MPLRTSLNSSSYKSLFCQRCLSRKAQRKRNSIGGGLSGISSTACGIDLKSLSPSSRNPCVLQQTQTVTQACHQTCTHIPSDSSVTSWSSTKINKPPRARQNGQDQFDRVGLSRRGQVCLMLWSFLCLKKTEVKKQLKQLSSHPGLPPPPSATYSHPHILSERCGDRVWRARHSHVHVPFNSHLTDEIKFNGLSVACNNFPLQGVWLETSLFFHKSWQNETTLVPFWHYENRVSLNKDI